MFIFIVGQYYYDDHAFMIEVDHMGRVGGGFGDPVKNGGIAVMYASTDVDACRADFEKVAEDLKSAYGRGRKVRYEIQSVQELDKLPKMWKNRVVHKLEES